MRASIAVPCAAGILAAAAFGVVAQAAPPTSGNLVLNQTITVNDDTTPNMSGAGSNYNPRIYGSKNYVIQINPAGFGRYAAGSNVAEAAVNINGDSTAERRIVTPLGGNAGSTYMLVGGGASSPGSATANYTFTQYDWNGANPVSATPFTAGTVSNASFDWIDSDTLIASTYQPSANRGRLYTLDVTATGPSFAMAQTNSLLGGNYYKDTSSPYIRNVTVGNVYNGYAYYGDGSGATVAGFNANFYALNLSTGVETLLGNMPISSSSGGTYAGVWSVTERGGYLYVMTTDDGINVYNMTNATTLGSLYTSYSDTELNTVTGNSSSVNWYGFDVSPDGSRMLLGSAGKTYELVAVPEPASLGLLALGGLLLGRRRK